MGAMTPAPVVAPRTARRPRSRRPAPLALALACLLGLLAACGGGDGTGAAALVNQGAVVVVANSAGTLSTNGPQRLLVALLGQNANDVKGGPDKPATIEITSEDRSVKADVPATWVAASGAALGLYVAHYTFPSPGNWEIRIQGATSKPSGVSVVNVKTHADIPDVGDPAPKSKTLTATDAASIAAISTDPAPNPAFYTTSIADAVTSGKPSVIVFATPAFCQTALCGPTVDVAKQVAASHPEVQWVHVEPYDIAQARTGKLIPIDVMAEWRLQTEPWVFLVGADGRVKGSFEGILSTDELGTAVNALAKG